MKKRNYLDENIKKLLGKTEPTAYLTNDEKKEILKNLLRTADMKEDKKKPMFVPFKLKIAAAIAAIIIVICGLYLFGKSAENKNIQNQTITKEAEKTQIAIPEKIKTAEVKNEIALIDVEKLAAAGDTNGLIAVLKTGSAETKAAAANYLAKLGAVGALETLKKEADNWQKISGKNPFTEAIEKIKTLQPNEPNVIGKIIEPNDPNDPNNWPFVEVWVVDKQTDEPVTGVKVKYNNGCGCGCGNNYLTTDQEGHCRVSFKDKNISYLSIYVEKAGFVPLFFNWGKEQQRDIPQEYTFYLEKGTVIGGLVKNEQNEPVQDANVIISFYDQEADKSKPYQRIEDWTIKTDINGKWQCDMIPAELSEERQVGIRILHPDYADYRTWAVPERVSIQQLRSQEFVIILKKGTAIYGYVLNNANRPIEKANVFIGEDRYNNDNLKAETDKNGYFEFAHAKQGLNVITVLAGGFAPDMKELNVYEKSQQADFVLMPGQTICGHVVDVNGNPVAGAGVNADEWRGYRMVNWSCKTDKDGRFVWDEAPADEVKFDFYKQGYMASRRNALKAGEKEYEVVLYPPLEIYGTVTIAETNEPVKNFTITKGLKFSGDNSQIHWENNNQNWGSVKSFTDGKYEFQITQPYYRHILRVDTSDGKVALSRFFDSNEGRVRYDFAVGKKSGNNLTGVVCNPDGNTAEGAAVYLVRKNQWPYIENGKQRYRQDIEKAITDAQGKFTLPDCNEKFKLVAVSDDGFADINSIEFSQEPVLHLENWGRIEGVVYTGSKPAAGQEIRTSPMSKYNDRDNINYQYSNVATTDQQGKFIMEKVIPCQNRIYRTLRTDNLEQSTSAAGQTVEVLPGQTAEIVLGGKGRTITGKIIWPNEDFYKKMLEINAYIQSQQPVNQRALFEKAYSEVGEIPKPAGFDTLTAKQVVEWYENWSQSDEGKAYYAKIMEAMEKSGVKSRGGSSGGVIVNSDGSFRAEDIEEGSYMINVRIMEKKGRYGQADYQNPLFHGKFDFVMPPVKESNIDQPLDLGEVTIKIIYGKQSLQADGNAPDFSLETTTGLIKLADFKEKQIVLVFWDAFSVLSNAENEAKMDGIFDAYRKYGSKAEFIGISASYFKLHQEISGKYLREKQCNWKQAFVGSYNQIFENYRYQYAIQAVLIGPDSKIIAAGIGGKELSEMLGRNPQ